MKRYARKIWDRLRVRLPVEGFFFDRPLVLLQSDDWGRVGLRDRDGFDQLRSAGLILGEQPYDLYTLEKSEDVFSLSQLLQSHRDASGRSACMVMNFLTANLDLVRMAADDYRQIHLKQISEGLPDSWQRPGLFDAYRHGIDAGVFYPALHGTTHCCRGAVESALAAGGERAELLRTLWAAGTPYIHWRMPWIGYEYWNPELPPEERSLSADVQAGLISAATATFIKFFGIGPRSACAPGFRADRNTHQAWARSGISVAQNGTGHIVPPHLDQYDLLQVYRVLDFEPAVDQQLTVETCMLNAEECFSKGLPLVISVHSINFHSSVKDFCSRTLAMLDEFLSRLESDYPDLLYLHDGDLYDLAQSGSYPLMGGPVVVSKRRFTKNSVARR